jgi:hypothetical protein
LSNSKAKNPVSSWIRLRIRLALGMLFNLAGIPGLLRDCNYQAGVADATIKVRVRDMFTIVTVNGFEIYFHRLTGSIDGVGVMSDCKPDQAPESVLFHEPSGSMHQTLQKRNE